MLSRLSPDNITSLAPDSQSYKSGKQLSSPRYWRSLGGDDRSLWGECQGSGSTPYRTIVAFDGPAFKCSCPSRKVPCKHCLGLLLLHSDNPSHSDAPSVAPIWVSDWIEKRTSKSLSENERARPAAKSAADADKKLEVRTAKTIEAIADLQNWLRDLVRQGLADLPGKGYAYWDSIAARMVDAQLPGVARQLREMAGIPLSGHDWNKRLLYKLGLLHLLIEGFLRRSDLAESTVADIKANLGWTVGKEELGTLPPVVDCWTVTGQRIIHEDRLKVRRTWLSGMTTGKSALLVHYAHGAAPFDMPMTVGAALAGELVYYPGSVPQRAAFQDSQALQPPVVPQLPFATVLEAMHSYASATASNPWLDLVPIYLGAVKLLAVAERWRLVDHESHSIPVVPAYDRIWSLMARSGGHELDIVGEWDGEAFFPLSIIEEGKLVTL